MNIIVDLFVMDFEQDSFKLLAIVKVYAMRSMATHAVTSSQW